MTGVTTPHALACVTYARKSLHYLFVCLHLLDSWKPWNVAKFIQNWTAACIRSIVCAMLHPQFCQKFLHTLSQLSVRFYQFVPCFLIRRLRKLFLFLSSYREYNLAFLLRVYARCSTVSSASASTSQISRVWVAHSHLGYYMYKQPYIFMYYIYTTNYSYINFNIIMFVPIIYMYNYIWYIYFCGGTDQFVPRPPKSWCF